MRAARHSLAANPDDARTHLVLGEAYVNLAFATRERARGRLVPHVPMVRQAQIALTRSMETLVDQEKKAESFLYLYYKRLSTAYEQIKANRAQREAFGEQLRTRQLEYDAGRGTLDTLLESQRFWADALANEYQAIVTYNNSLVGFEFAKGSIMQHDNVVIAEGQLPT